MQAASDYAPTNEIAARMFGQFGRGVRPERYPPRGEYELCIAHRFVRTATSPHENVAEDSASRLQQVGVASRLQSVPVVADSRKRAAREGLCDPGWTGAAAIGVHRSHDFMLRLLSSWKTSRPKGSALGGKTAPWRALVSGRVAGSLQSRFSFRTNLSSGTGRLRLGFALVHIFVENEGPDLSSERPDLRLRRLPRRKMPMATPSSLP